MSLKLNSSGGGSVTLQEPVTASNLTLNLPSADGTVVAADGSGNATFAGTVTATSFVGNGSGNATFAGTVTATSFVGNGSALTGIAGGFSNMQVFTSSGSWTVPAGVTKAKVTVVGGGGGGGGAKGQYGGNGNGGRGSCGGGSQRVVTGLTPGASIVVTVGTGGGGGAPNNQSNATPGSTGGSGNTSSFGAFCSATGGAGGSGGFTVNTICGTIAQPGSDSLVGGIGSGGDLNVPGAQMSAFGLGAANGNYGNTQTGRGYGGGGGGGTSGPTAGAAGSAGVVIVEW